MRNFAFLKKDSPFFPLFADKDGAVPILNILVPGQAVCEGDGPAQDVYMVDLAKLEPERFEAVVKLCNARCPEISHEQCAAEIRKLGLPLRASQTTGVSSDCMAWL